MIHTNERPEAAGKTWKGKTALSIADGLAAIVKLECNTEHHKRQYRLQIWIF